jgi:hypothetical protein
MTIQLKAVQVVAAMALALAAVACRAAQPPQKPDGGGRPLPQDKRMLDLYIKFVKDAERLAAEYERDKQPEKAREVYKEILSVVPDYVRAKKKLQEYFEKEATAERKVVEIQANQAWQKTGVKLIPGKPITIQATGTWTFKMSQKLGPGGMVIPKELRNFNLGALVGIVMPEGPINEKNKPKPFLVGDGTQFVAGGAGHLMLRMYDSDPSDNLGKMKVEIIGTFE